MKVMTWLLGIAGAIAVVVFGAGQLGFLAGSAPPDLGVKDGRLAPPSLNPNSVSTQAKLYPGHAQQMYAEIDPFTFQGSGEAAMERLAKIVAGMPRTVIVRQQPGYLYAQSSTRFFKFTDDVEFWLDTSAGVIQFRSASRLGRRDFGVNRARMEAIRAWLRQS